MHPLAITAVLLAILSVRGAPEAAGLPPVFEVQRVAIACARVDVDEAAGWRRKARRAAFLPKFQIDFGQKFRNDIDIVINDNVYVGASGVVVGPEKGKYSSGRLSDQNLGFRAVWELGETVFSTKQLSASAEARRVVQARNSIISDVSRHYQLVAGFSQEASILARMAETAKNPGAVEHKIFLRKIACRESAAVLDGLTSGWFSKASSGEICGRMAKGGDSS